MRPHPAEVAEETPHRGDVLTGLEVPNGLDVMIRGVAPLARADLPQKENRFLRELIGALKCAEAEPLPMHTCRKGSRTDKCSNR